jgi:hypothetical protein
MKRRFVRILNKKQKGLAIRPAAAQAAPQNVINLMDALKSHRRFEKEHMDALKKSIKQGKPIERRIPEAQIACQEGRAFDSAGKKGRMISDPSTISGPLMDELLDAVADAIADAIDEGMEPMQVASAVAISVAAYGRAAYGDDVLDELAGTIKLRRGKPLELDGMDDDEEAGHA